MCDSTNMVHLSHVHKYSCARFCKHTCTQRTTYICPIVNGFKKDVEVAYTVIYYPIGSFQNDREFFKGQLPCCCTALLSSVLVCNCNCSRSLVHQKQSCYNNIVRVCTYCSSFIC